LANTGVLDWQWSISESKLLMNTVNKLSEYFKANLFEHFTRLPGYGRVVQIFNKV